MSLLLDGHAVDVEFKECDLNDVVPHEKTSMNVDAILDKATQEFREALQETKGQWDQEVRRLDIHLARLEEKIENVVGQQSPVLDYSSRSQRTSSAMGGNKGNGFQISESFSRKRTSKSYVDIPFMGKEVEQGIPVLTTHLHEAIVQDWIYIFSDTIWDSLLFCGLRVMGLVEEVIVVVVFLANIIVQEMFIRLVWDNMTDNVFGNSDIVETMQDWRVLYGQHPDYADRFTATPLSRDVCERSQLLMQGSGQAALYAEIYAYLNTFFGLPAGAVLCLLSVFLWLLTCWQEVVQLSLFAIGIWTPRDKSSSIRAVRTSSVEIIAPVVVWEHDEATQKNFQLHISFSRAVVMSIIVVSPRLAILLRLCYVGIIFLASTTELTELILNAVALEVVLNVDELFFQTFLPRMAWRMIRKTLPLRVPRITTILSTCICIGKIFAVALGLFLVWLAFLDPYVNVMKDAEHVMCHGDLDFFAVQLQYGPVVVAASTGTEVNRSSFKYKSISQRIGLEELDRQKTYIEGAPFNTFENGNVQDVMRIWEQRTLPDWAAQFNIEDLTLRPCHDEAHSAVFGFYNFPTWAALQYLTGNSSLRNCTHAIQYCAGGNITGQIVRLICPVTCGGDDPYSGQAMDTEVDGMPASCRAVAETISASKDNIPPYVAASSKQCVDPSPDELSENAAWNLYHTTINAKMRKLFYSVRANESYIAYWENELVEGMTKLGCKYFAQPRIIQLPLADTTSDLVINYCDTDSVHGRSVQALCPMTCNCTITLVHQAGSLCPAYCTYAEAVSHEAAAGEERNPVMNGSIVKNITTGIWNGSTTVNSFGNGAWNGIGDGGYNEGKR